MVGALGFLWIADAPVLDLFEFDETLFDSELALILVVLLHIVEKAARFPTVVTILVLIFDDFASTHANTVRSNVSRTEHRLVLAICEEVGALIWKDA